jgi:hypothetical protein
VVFGGTGFDVFTVAPFCVVASSSTPFYGVRHGAALHLQLGHARQLDARARLLVEGLDGPDLLPAERDRQRLLQEDVVARGGRHGEERGDGE